MRVVKYLERIEWDLIAKEGYLKECGDVCSEEEEVEVVVVKNRNGHAESEIKLSLLLSAP
jgi:hypothetical protein